MTHITNTIKNDIVVAELKNKLTENKKTPIDKNEEVTPEK